MEDRKTSDGLELVFEEGMIHGGKRIPDRLLEPDDLEMRVGAALDVVDGFLRGKLPAHDRTQDSLGSVVYNDPSGEFYEDPTYISSDLYVRIRRRADPNETVIVIRPVCCWDLVAPGTFEVGPEIEQELTSYTRVKEAELRTRSEAHKHYLELRWRVDYLRRAKENLVGEIKREFKILEEHSTPDPNAGRDDPMPETFRDRKFQKFWEDEQAGKNVCLKDLAKELILDYGYVRNLYSTWKQVQGYGKRHDKR